MRTKAIVSLLMLFGLLFVFDGESYAKNEKSDGKDIHVQYIDDPETGIKGFGIGKSRKGKPPKGQESGGAGFDLCKMGTGIDGDWYITGETYTFTSSDGVYLGAQYTDLYEGRSTGHGWHRPDSSLYYENRNDFQIPDPPPSEYWVWYNVAYWYDPMPSGMSSVPGYWTAKWYDNGSNVCSKTFNVCTAPPAPTGVSASDGTICGQVSITWSTPGSFQYRVYRDGSPIGSWQSSTSYTDSPGDCSAHTYQVKARNTCGSYPESGLSSGNSGNAKCAPSAPTGVSATDGTVCDQVSITWGSVSGADTYRVYRDGSPIGSWQAGTSYNDSPGDTAIHSYQVMAQNSCGPSSLSSSDNGNAGSSPSAPTGVSATDGTVCDQVSITWGSVSGADTYRVYRDGSPIGSWQAGTSYNDSPGDTAIHSYQVMAQNSCGPSSLSSSDNGNANSSPSAPTGVVASDATYCDYVHITWNPSSGADEYRVYWDGSPIGSWQAGTTYDDYIGDCNTHTYQVKAQNSCGESGLSAGDPGKTMCTPVITLDPVQDPNPVCDGNDVTFTVVATGDSLHYQWKVDDVNVGFDNPSYLWEDANLSDDGAQVVCEVWNDCDIVTSNATTLNVDSCVSLIAHQSDSDSDWRIVISEVTSYGACWKTGCTWPVEPNPIPIGYVTNCGYLWKVGECYDYNDLEVPPQCWQPAICNGGSVLMMGGGAGGPVSWNFNPLYYTPETPVEVSIEITPDPGTMVYAVEDAPPTGWTVDSINESGNWDDVNKKVKWGPFFDANIRTLTYNATSPVAETGEKTFSGTASFDGSDEPFVRTISDVCPLDGVGNLDDDCDIDFVDFSIFASHWLEGVQ